MLKSLFRRTKRSRADEIYVSLVARARHEDFYSAGVVPDTFDGRFEMMVMHLYLVHLQLQNWKQLFLATCFQTMMKVMLLYKAKH